MTEQKRINHPSTGYGIQKFFTELEKAIIEEGYRIPEGFGSAKCWWGARHAITLVKDVQEVEVEEAPLDRLSNPKLKKAEVIKIAEEDFGLEVPKELASPNAIKKFIRENAETPSEE